ncbi:ferrochelatase [Rhodococcus sp. NPDC058521]|uniref:ferrochelatase n=1 Tax=Rhodococcus sp. NPDC058521 TaxID=3346536 RepID=UPI003668D916
MEAMHASSAAGPIDVEVDALLVLSFGGPEKPEDVRPFLENVTRGRGVPPERLDAVVEHYMHFGGVSPINALNRDIISRIESELTGAAKDLPVYFGNRNWHPMIEDTVDRMRTEGVKSALVFPTSAWGGYSGCRQYHEDIARARDSVGDGAPELRKLRQYYDHPLLIDSFADAVRAARLRLSSGVRDKARLVFTAHSVPTSADAAAGPPSAGGHLYSRQVAEAARLTAGSVGVEDYDLVWQSRSGPPHIPWLEPDICDHLDDLAEAGVPAVVVCPVGFVSDHLEVVWDLDTEAEEKARELGIEFTRVATPGTDERFARMVLELVDELTAGGEVRRLGTAPLLGASTNGSPCGSGCCEPPLRTSGRPSLSN